jgi:hypothetical protein
MNMLTRISASDLLEREPVDLPEMAAVEPIAADAPVQPAARPRNARRPLPQRTIAYVSPEEEAALTLLSREERILVLISRGSSRLAMLAASWAGGVERRLPASDEEQAVARAERTRHNALRRFAILYRLEGSGIAFEEEARMQAAGYSDAQIDAVRFLVSRFDRSWSPPRARWSKSLAFLALTIAGAWLLESWIGPAIDDTLLAWMLSIIAATATASFMAVTAHPAGASR